MKSEKLFGEMDVRSAIFILAMPALLNILVMLLYNMADMFFIAQLGNNAMLAAISLSSPIFSIIMATGTLIGTGSTVLISRCMGAKNYETVKTYSFFSFVLSLCFGLFIMQVIWIFKKPIVSVLGANDEIFNYLEDYLFILSFGSPFMVFSTSFSGIVRSEGAVKEGMFSNLISTCVNLVMDPIFIFELGLGVKGAAIATVIGNIAGCVFLLIYILKKSRFLTISPRGIEFSMKYFYPILILGLPNGLSTFLSAFSSTLANRLMVGYGTEAVAAAAASSKVAMLVSMVQMGLCIGLQPFFAYNFGSNNLNRLKEAVLKLSVFTFIFGAFSLIIIRIYSSELVSVFIKEEEALILGIRMVRIQTLIGPVLGLYYLSSTFLQASGKAMLSVLVTAFRQGILFIPLIYLMNHFFGVEGNILSHFISDFLSALLGIFLMRHVWNRIKNKGINL